MRRLLLTLRTAASSPVRNARSATVLGRLLGAAFLICLLTGLYSHFLQEPASWMRFPTSPVWLYQVTQGIHITAGIASIPLLLGKLHAVFPQLFQHPPVRHPVQVLERASIALFVATSVLQLVTGLLNTYQWYPWPFPFKQVHFALSFVIIGSLAVHIAVKLPLITRYWRARDSYDAEGRFVEPAGELDPARAEHEAVRELARMRRDEAPTSTSQPDAGAAPTDAPQPRGLVGRVTRWIDDAREPERDPARARVSRRGFFGAVGASTVGVVALTAGQSFTPLQPLNAFGPRQRGIGPNDLPVNRTASAAKVLETAMDPDWQLTIAHGERTMAFTAADLEAMAQGDERLPISCVEGWSQTAHWRGPRLVELMALVGAPADRSLRVTSLEAKGGYRVMLMGPEYATDPATLVALEVNGGRLDIEHGYPARMIAPGRPGVLQTKWLSLIEVI
ncbi:molybdopterin-dependent oxidoreductase [Frigoribacterium sp. PvP032]|uniref:molybdopterin-dependent oxidoreductase n=1 Tax=Frigoribacterium sp. PvP032 TaxID=2806589 RepID=UPI001AE5440E|nr:molybdopterin-dependent oxidoreductase [Frigoribacterium sp. PvP032]MBP1191524.1 DMSO/TMAO reductase YedYZ molybdopterin-dependent catalytic subunit [Frigoribacterium sp. PvP032]